MISVGNYLFGTLFLSFLNFLLSSRKKYSKSVFLTKLILIIITYLTNYIKDMVTNILLSIHTIILHTSLNFGPIITIFGLNIELYKFYNFVYITIYKHCIQTYQYNY